MAVRSAKARRRRSIRSDAAIFLVAGSIVNLSNFAFHTIAGRSLGPVGYGAFSSLINLINVVALPLTALQLVATRTWVRRSHDGESSISRSLATIGSVSALALVLFLVSAYPIAEFLHVDSVADMVTIAVWIPLALFGALLQGTLIGEYQYREVAIALFAGGAIIRLMLGSFLMNAGIGVFGGLLATVAGQAITTGMLLWANREHLKVGSKPLQFKLAETILPTSSLAGYAFLMGLDVFLARHFLTSGIAGSYAASALTGHMVLYVAGGLVAVMFPFLIPTKESQVPPLRALFVTVALSLIAAVPCSIAIAVVGTRVTRLIFGVSFSPRADVVAVLALANVFLVVGNVLTYYFLARHSKLGLLNCAGIPIGVVGVLVLHHSPLEIAVMTMTAYAAVVLAQSVALVPELKKWAGESTRAVIRNEESEERITCDVSFIVAVDTQIADASITARTLAETLTQLEGTAEVILVGPSSAIARVQMPPGVVSKPVASASERGDYFVSGIPMAAGRYLVMLRAASSVSSGEILAALNVVIHEDADLVSVPSYEAGHGVTALTPLKLAVALCIRLFCWHSRLGASDLCPKLLVVKRHVAEEVSPLLLENSGAVEAEFLFLSRLVGHEHYTECLPRDGQAGSSTAGYGTSATFALDLVRVIVRHRILHSYDAVLLRRGVQFLPSNGLPTRRSGESIDGIVPPHKVLILNWRDLKHPRAGGAEIYTHNLAKAWVAMGADVTLLCSKVRGAPRREVIDGVSVIRRGNKWTVYRAARRVLKKVGEEDCELIIDEINTRPFFAHKWARGVPVIALAHQVCNELWEYQLPRPIAVVGRRVLEPRWLSQYRNIPTVTVSQSSRDSLTSYGLRKVVVIPEGHTQLLDFTPPPKESRPTVCFVGRLESHKRPEHAIAAFESIRDEFPEAQMWVIGGGPLERALRQSSSPAVHFLGRVSHEKKLERLARAHVILVTSVREGWGLVVTEAAEVGTISIGYDVPGLRDSISASGGLLTAESPDALSEMLRNYFQDRRHGRQLSPAPGGVLGWDEVAKAITKFARVCYGERTWLESSSS